MSPAIIQKIYVPVEETGSKTVTRKFREAGLTARNADIDGFNVFAALVEPKLRHTLGIQDERPFELSATGWKNLWDAAGIPAPGKIPSGAMAIISFAREPQGNAYHARAEVEEITRSSGPLGSTIVLAFSHTAEKNAGTGPAQDTFVVAIVPKATDWTYSLQSGTPLSAPTLVTDHLNSGTVNTSKPREKLSVTDSLKRAAGLDTSPAALGQRLLDEHNKSLLKPAPSQKCFDLVNAGADLTIQDSHGSDILMQAAGYGHVDLVKLLLAKGASIDTKTKHGYDAEHMAQEVADNVQYRTDPHSQQAFKDYSEIIKMIKDERAARLQAAQPQPAEPDVVVIVVEETPAPAPPPVAEAVAITVRRPLSFKKPTS